MVRENRYDNEMNFLLFGCFFLYMALQVFCNAGYRPELVNGIRQILYLTFVSGLIFRQGRCLCRKMKETSRESGKRRVLFSALRYYAYFFLLALAWEVISSGSPFLYALNRVLTALTIPAVSAPFFSAAWMLVMVWLLYDKLRLLTANTKWMLTAGILCLLCAFLRPSGECYALVAAVFGNAQGTAVPGLPCFAWFLLGMWFEEKRPGLSWKLASGAFAVTAASLLLYHTSLQPLCRITLSMLPVYAMYAAAEYLNRLGNKFRGAAFAFGSIEPVFWLCCGGLFALRYVKGDTLGPGYGLKKTFVLALALLALIYGALLGFAAFRFLYGKGEAYLSRVKHKKTAYFTVYTIVFACLLLLVFSPFLAAGRDLLWRTDGIPQYYPKAVYFARYIRELFSSFLRGDFTLPMYDFSIGMGSAVTYSMEPLYFLYGVFGEEHVQLAYNVIALLRFYLAGITSSIFMLYFKKDYVTTFIASVTYVFCGFALYGGARHTMFMIPMIMLPLLILAIEEILREKRWYLCTLFVAVSLLSNYYYLYMNTIAMGIYFLVRFFCQRERERRTLRKFIARGLVISGSYLLGVAMSCIVLVTTFGLYVSSGRNGSSTISTPSLFYYSAQWPVRCFLSFLTTANSPGEWLKLGFLPLSLLAVTFLFGRKGRKELKLFSVIGGVMMMLPLAGFVFSGFNSVINRWCYMLALLVAYILADCLPDMRRMERRDILLCLGVTGAYGFLAFFGSILSTKYTKLAFVFLTVTLAVVLLGQDRVKGVSRLTKQCLMLLLTVAMVFYNGFSLFYMDGAAQEYTKLDRAKPKAENTPLAAISQMEDDSFYRVTVPKLDYLTVSTSLILGYNGITQFSSTLNGVITRYLAEMGSTGYSVTQLLGLGNRTFMNALASVKYCAYYDGVNKTLPYGYEEVLHTEVNGQDTTVCENRYALPLGYTYREAISEEELEAYDTLKRQEVLLQKVLLNDSEDTGNNDARITLEPLDITGITAKGFSMTEDSITAEKKKGKLTLQFESEPNSETYLVLKNARVTDTEEDVTLTFKTEGNSTEYRFRSETDRYGTAQEDYVINLGYHEEAITSCTIRTNRKGTIVFDSLQLYSQPMDVLEAYTADLTEDVLENVTVETNRISGEIALEEDKILVLSIPYQRGWTAWVDGEKTALERANYMYMALPLSQGSHTIELEFEIPGVKYACIIMPASAVLFLILCLFTRIRKKKH